MNFRSHKYKSSEKTWLVNKRYESKNKGPKGRMKKKNRTKF